MTESGRKAETKKTSHMSNAWKVTDRLSHLSVSAGGRRRIQFLAGGDRGLPDSVCFSLGIGNWEWIQWSLALDASCMYCSLFKGDCFQNRGVLVVTQL